MLEQELIQVFIILRAPIREALPSLRRMEVGGEVLLGYEESMFLERWILVYRLLLLTSRCILGDEGCILAICGDDLGITCDTCELSHSLDLRDLSE